MKKNYLILFLFILINTLSNAQNYLNINDITNKHVQSYTDRGYSLVSSTIIEKANIDNPVVSPIIDFQADTYYIIVILVENSIYCKYNLSFVNEKDIIESSDFQYVFEEDLKIGIKKFTNKSFLRGKYVVQFDTEDYNNTSLLFFKK